MQVDLRVITCCAVLFYSFAGAQISDDECAAYHELHSTSDYETFFEDCAGKEVLGFEEGVSNKFRARHMTEQMFNKVFVNARIIKFHIYVQNSDFEHLALPNLEELSGLTVRNNERLRSFRIRRGLQFDRKSDGPTTVTVDGNRVLDADSMADLRHLCPYCDIFEWSKCSALEAVSPEDYDQLVQNCRGEKIIKSKPRTKLFLDLSKMSQEQFQMLFAEATHVKMCITAKDVSWTEVVFPKLVRLIPCGPGDRSLKAVHNPNLKLINFPVYNSEGFGRLNSMINVELRNNFILPEPILTSMKRYCRFCTIQVYKECDRILPRQTRNATKFVELCGGKRIWKPLGNAVIRLDISRLSQDLVDELFQDITYIKMCITMRKSQVKTLMMPFLTELHTCEPGRPAFLIEGNMKLETIQVSQAFKWEVSEESFHMVYNPQLRVYPNLDQCKYCVFEQETQCGAVGRSLSYSSVSQVLEICPGKRKIVFQEQITVTQEQFSQLCSQALYLEMCFNVTDTDYTAINCPNLRAIRSCFHGSQVFTITMNNMLETISIPANVIYPKESKFMIVQKNPRIPPPKIEELKKICPHCMIEGFFSKCVDVDKVQTLDEFMELCAGQPIISTRRGLIMQFNFTQTQINQLFAEAVEVDMCLNIRATQIQSITLPKLTRWKSCATGENAISFINNFYLQKMDLPLCKNGGCIENGIVHGNLRLGNEEMQMLHRWCPACDLQNYVLACGLGDKQYTTEDFVRACAGQEIIVPRTGTTVIIESSKVSEEEMNGFCSNAVYMQVCLVITESSYRSLRCPRLQELRPCQPGRPAIEIVSNYKLEIVDIPTSIIVPPGEKILRVTRNALLSSTVITSLKTICPGCQIDDHFSSCSDLENVDDIDLIVRKCSGQPIIAVKSGLEIKQSLTQVQIERLFSEAVEVRMCLKVESSSVKSLVFPKLSRWMSCSSDRPGLVVRNNADLVKLQFPLCGQRCIQSAVIEGNPLVSKSEIDIIQNVCINCIVEYEAPACGIKSGQVTAKQLVNACAGKKIIKSSSSIVIHSSEVTEYEFNKFCSQAVFMEACIVIKESDYKSVRCPHLQHIRPCQPGKPVFEIVDNSELVDVKISSKVEFSAGEDVIVVKGNPKLPPVATKKLENLCPYCNIVSDYSRCNSIGSFESVSELLEQCSGESTIIGRPGLTIESNFTETEINRLFSGAVEIRLCLVVRESQLTSLVFPKLKRWRSCAPGKQAITVVENLHLKELSFPSCRQQGCIDGVVIKDNPELSLQQIQVIQKWCTNCHVESNLPACGIRGGQVPTKQLVNQCAGKKIIKPAKNSSIVIYSSEVTEQAFNRFCSEAVFIEACIVIKESNYKNIRCPKLQRIKSCHPDRPVFEITENYDLVNVELPTTMTFSYKEDVLVVNKNPKLSTVVTSRLKKTCPCCEIVSHYSRCSSLGPISDVDELLEQCAGQPVIIAAHSTTLKFNLTETKLNRLFSGAVEVQMCLDVRNTQITSLVFPRLKRWKACAPNKAAITVVNNVHLRKLEFPACQNKGCVENMVIADNPELSEVHIEQIRQWCINCRLQNYVPACGLGNNPFTVKQFVKACAGKQIIKQSEQTIIIRSSEVSEEEMISFCSQAVYMEACIVIDNSAYKSLRCPYLKELRSCRHDKPAITITSNSLLETVHIPPSVSYSWGEKIMVVKQNAILSSNVIVSLKEICPHCEIEAIRSRCSGLNGIGNIEEFIEKCAGEPIITGQGLIIEKELTETQIIRLFSAAVEVQMCLSIEGTPIRNLVFPKLTQWKSCDSEKPGLIVKNNLRLTNLQFPSCTRHGCIESAVIRGNPYLAEEQFKSISIWCTNCVFEESSLACGIKKQRYTAKEFARACAGREVIRPRDDYFVVIKAQEVTEEELNRFCSNAIFMQTCIVISMTTMKGLRCPNLREIRSCQPGRPAITIRRNTEFEILSIPMTTIYPERERIIEIKENPKMSITLIQSLKVWCRHCVIIAGTFKKRAAPAPRLRRCSLEGRRYSDKELAATCAGAQVIKPHSRFYLTVSSSKVTAQEMNALFSEAVIMEICITVVNSDYKKLRFPHLREIRSCLPGRPAMKIVGNMYLREFHIPRSIKFEQDVSIFEIAENPHVSVEIIEWLQKICTRCKVTANLGCDLETRIYSEKELVAACAGKRIIRPAKGFMLMLSSDSTTEEQVNAMCSKAVFMEICIDITRSDFRRLSCPHLRELMPCEPGRPAIRIVNNYNFDTLEIPYRLSFDRREKIFEILDNPHLSTRIINKLKRLCPACKLGANVVCGLEKRRYSDEELVQTCAGKKVIKPAQGFFLTLSSEKVTEEQMNAFCSEAVFMEICITISDSNYKSLHCPHLRHMRSCRRNEPALKIVNNSMLERVDISQSLLYRPGTKTLEVCDNPRLSSSSLEALSVLCPECKIEQ